MKVETPQILWNNEADKGINAPLLSIDILGSGIAKSNSSEVAQAQNMNTNSNECTHVLVTAGNADCINLWRVSFGLQQQPSQQQTELAKGGNKSCCSDSSIFQKQSKPLFNKIDYMMSLTRHDVTVNSVAFSPDGLHLATAGDSGNIVVWSVPVNKRGNNNGRHFWFTLSSEKDLTVRIVSTHCEGIVDLSWSADSKRFTVGTIDSCVLIYEDKQYGINACSPETHRKESDWQLVFRNADQHSSFVQGVAYDPLDVYIASMGGDRTVRVFPRKAPLKSKKKVLRPANTSIIAGTNAAAALVTPPPHEHQRMVSRILTEAKLELGKPKRIKQRSITVEDCIGFENQNVINLKSQVEECQSAQQQQIKQIKHKLFVDESNCESFFRRLNWTVDGAFLVTPAALWHGDNNTDGEKKAPSSPSASPLFSTYLFARHRFEEPFRVLTGLGKPSVVVQPNPVLFELPSSVLEELKENQYPLSRTVISNGNGSKQYPFPSSSQSSLPYRSIFAVLTLDSILIYDTHHAAPLSVLQGLHYSGLTDCCWSSDGMNLIVCSSDGYISIINFTDGELGKVYSSPSLKDDVVSTTTDSHLDGITQAEQTVQELPPIELPPLPQCDQDLSQAVLVAPAAKKARKTRITPTLVSNGICSSSTRVVNGMIASQSAIKKKTTTKRAVSETEIVGDVVTKLSLDNNNVQSVRNKNINNGGEVILSSEKKPKKKKKRVQPFLVSSKY